eukprot:TRINITY_DN4025_c0_g2_i1.p1 TRINITY_DN4025_c0_g2~~TRINITY_DN4025_c0_g2_i1.p1  ORF type:complete len:470 (+),score=66.25 TRINITY_DN4025_c0_g2_i1:96-1412(+)
MASRVSILLVLMVLMVSIPSSVNSWGYDGHRNIVEAATKLMPYPWQNMLREYNSTLRYYVTKPDELSHGAYADVERYRHFDNFEDPHEDIDVLVGSTDYELGVVSWAVLNATDNLTFAADNYGAVTETRYCDETDLKRRTVTQTDEVTGLESETRAEIVDDTSQMETDYEENDNTEKYDYGDELELWLKQYAFVSHYIGDSNQPLHATANYDGKETGNNGIHSRFETTLTNRYWDVLYASMNFTEPSYINDVFGQGEANVGSGNALVDEIFAADNISKAITDGVYNTTYYESMYSLLEPLLKDRLQQAIQQTADMWYTALSNSNSDFLTGSCVRFEDGVGGTATGSNVIGKDIIQPTFSDSTAVIPSGTHVVIIIVIQCFSVGFIVFAMVLFAIWRGRGTYALSEEDVERNGGPRELNGGSGDTNPLLMDSHTLARGV